MGKMIDRFMSNRELRVKVVKPGKDESTSIDDILEEPTVNIEQIAAVAEIAKDFVTHACIAVGAVIVTRYVSVAITETFVSIVKSRLRR